VTNLGLDESAANEVSEAVIGIAAILFLRPMPTRDEQDAAIFVETLTRKSSQSSLDALLERTSSGEIEAQLHRGGDFVDVLAARTGRADEALLEIGVWDLDLT
jgi:hypothetical protein